MCGWFFSAQEVEEKRTVEENKGNKGVATRVMGEEEEGERGKGELKILHIQS